MIKQVVPSCPVIFFKPRDQIEKLAYGLKSTEDVKHGSLTMVTTGSENGIGRLFPRR